MKPEQWLSINKESCDKKSNLSAKLRHIFSSSINSLLGVFTGLAPAPAVFRQGITQRWKVPFKRLDSVLGKTACGLLAFAPATQTDRHCYQPLKGCTFLLVVNICRVLKASGILETRTTSGSWLPSPGWVVRVMAASNQVIGLLCL